MKIFSCLWAILVAAPFSFAADRSENSQPSSEVYAVATDGTPLTWDVYLPAGTGPWPAVLVIHGGDFWGGDPTNPGAVTCAQDLADAGYIAFSIAYRLAPPGSIPGQSSLGRFPDQYDDVHLAVQAARSDPRCNGQVGSVGGSSGASHTVWAATTGTPGADRLDLGVGLSGAYDYSDFSPDQFLDYFVTIVTNYVGVPETDTEALRAASPAWIVNSSVAPLFLVDSEGDLMPSVQLADMLTHLADIGATDYQGMTIPGSNHSFANWPDIKTDALAFLASHFGKPTPTPTPTATPSPSISPTPTATPTVTPSATPIPTATPGASPNTLLNISTRGSAATGTNALIGGFILGDGDGLKKVIVRALGPSLAKAGIANALADPSLQLIDSTDHVLAANDDWMTSGQADEIEATSLAPGDPREPAIVASLASGAYTVLLNGAEGTDNIALVEVFDLDASHAPQLLNISTRGHVATGDGVMIAGTILGGAQEETLLLRGLGPSLAALGISTSLPDPTLSVVNSQGTVIASNENWQETQGAEIAATGLSPTDPLEAALLLTLTPGAYTVLLSDAQNAVGVGLVEIYHLLDNQTQTRR